MGNIKFRYYDTLSKYKKRLYRGKRFEGNYNININTIRRCAVVVGRNPWAAKDPVEVLKWRLSLINSFIEVLPSGEVRIKNIDYLETTEKNSVGYMIGMIFAQIFAQELLGIRHLKHLTSEEVNVRTEGKSPDLCGYNKTKNRGYLLEAKGSTVLSNKMDNETVEKAYKQLDSVSEIQFTRIRGTFKGNSLTKYIVANHPNFYGDIEQEIIDPFKEETSKIKVDCDLMILEHYYNVYTLLKKYKKDQFLRAEFIVVPVEGCKFYIGMLEKIYNYLNPIYEKVSMDVSNYSNELKKLNKSQIDIYTQVDEILDEWHQNKKMYINVDNLNLMEKKMIESEISEKDSTNNDMNDNKEGTSNDDESVGTDGIYVYSY